MKVFSIKLTQTMTTIWCKYPLLMRFVQLKDLNVMVQVQGSYRCQQVTEINMENLNKMSGTLCNSKFNAFDEDGIKQET